MRTIQSAAPTAAVPAAPAPAAAPEAIEFRGLVKEYQVDKRIHRVLDGVDLRIEPGEFVSIIGHSGCGKSTLLRILAGLEPYQGGSVEVGGRPVEGPGADRGMIFQDHMLLPWMTVRKNLEFGYYEPDQAVRDAVIDRLLALVGLTGFENAYPRQLSGGMAQRASIARALLHSPQILLLDEPFGALDAITRMQMQQEVLRIWREERTTMALVTHDIDEAVFLSDRVVILDGQPARVKDVIPIALGRPRDRGGIEFAKVRKRVYDSFFGEAAQTVEYVI